jgi:hypothetical protein
MLSSIMLVLVGLLTLFFAVIVLLLVLGVVHEARDLDTATQF